MSGLLSSRRNPALAAAFAGSYAITFLAHLIGYHDIALYTLALAVVFVRNPTVRFCFAIPVCVAALLVHEVFLLTALAPILFSFFAEKKQSGAGRHRAFAGIVLAVCLLVTFTVSLKPSLTPEALQAFKHQTVASASYPIDDRVLDVVGRSVMDNVKLNFQVIGCNLWWWAELGVAIMTLGPLIGLLVHGASRLACGVRWIAFLSATFAPLSMNVLGWDNVRWLTMCALTAFINLGLLTRADDTPPSNEADGRECHAAILILGLGLASGYGLMDGKKINPYPFFPPAVRPAVLRHDGPAGQIL